MKLVTGLVSTTPSRVDVPAPAILSPILLLRLLLPMVALPAVTLALAEAPTPSVCSSL